ncbi:MAG: protein-L-isoaspartate(D-aspartate) O-methyltransferase [Bacteroidetes bacterium]|nr:MAG: protein-L-isoaspartate(D-aspartate) O-methyltransferase [Bacteroidota bacterium]
MKDSYLQKGKRRKLVAVIRKKGIRDERVLKAIEELPRHFFMAKDFESWAYEDKAFPIGNEQTISQPFTVAYQTALLDVHPREKVLEIGTGSGYQAAILSLLGARVYTIERQKALYDKTKKLLKKLGFGGIRVFYKDGYLGLPEFAPFHKILITAGAPEIPKALLEQLKIGGKMVVPVGKEVQTMYCITRTGENEYEEETFADFRFVPFLKGTQ